MEFPTCTLTGSDFVMVDICYEQAYGYLRAHPSARCLQPNAHSRSISTFYKLEQPDPRYSLASGSYPNHGYPTDPNRHKRA